MFYVELWKSLTWSNAHNLLCVIFFPSNSRGREWIFKSDNEPYCCQRLSGGWSETIEGLDWGSSCLMQSSRTRFLIWQGQARVYATCCKSTRTRAALQSWASAVSVKLCADTTIGPSFSLLPQLPSRCQSRKDEQRVGMVLCPSPPSGAACLCQDVSLHIVMKGVIKVTAGWNVADSSSLPLYPSSLSLVSHILYVRCKSLVISIIFFSGLALLSTLDVLLIHFLATGHWTPLRLIKKGHFLIHNLKHSFILTYRHKVLVKKGQLYCI